MISVIDSGICNLASVTTALDRIGARWTIAASAANVAGAEALLLPGVGAFADGMAALTARGLVEPVRAHAAAGRPILGICLGMQLLAEVSEEFGEHPGLGLIAGRVRRLPEVPALRVPNIGWCDTVPEEGTPLFRGIARGAAFYYVHSYYVDCDDPSDVAARIPFGPHHVAAALHRDRVFGAQFHPEKSQDVGLAVLANFAQLVKD